MSSLESMSKQVQLMTAQASPPVVPDYVLGRELLAEFWQEFGYEVDLLEDATVTDDARAALLLDYRRQREEEKTPERLAQERRFYLRYDAAGAKERLLRELQHQIGQEDMR